MGRRNWTRSLANSLAALFYYAACRCSENCRKIDGVPYSCQTQNSPNPVTPFPCHKYILTWFSMHHFSLIDKPRKPASPLTVTDKLNKISVSIIFHFTQKERVWFLRFVRLWSMTDSDCLTKKKKFFPRVPSFIANELVQWWISSKRIPSVVDKSVIMWSRKKSFWTLIV